MSNLRFTSFRVSVFAAAALLTVGCARQARSDTGQALSPIADPALATAPEPREWRGHYRAGWESAVFEPCGVGETWWAWSGEKVLRHDTNGWGQAFVVVRGRVSEPGAYGHLDRYRRQIVITEVVRVVEDGSGCAAAPL